MASRAVTKPKASPATPARRKNTSSPQRHNTSQPMTLLEVISRVAADPTADVEKLKALMEIRDQMEAKEAKTEFHQAMAEAQAEMQVVVKNAKNEQTRSKYATFDQIDRLIRPVYSGHGFSVGYDAVQAESADSGSVTAICTVTRGMHQEQHSFTVPVVTVGAKGNQVMTPTHATMSALSYAKRATLCMAFNIATGEADDDGNAAGGAKLITLEQCEQINELVAMSTDPSVTGRAVMEMAGLNKDGVFDFEIAQCPAKKVPEILKCLREGKAQREKEMSET